MTSIELSLGKLQNSNNFFFYCTYSKRHTIVSKFCLVLRSSATGRKVGNGNKQTKKTSGQTTPMIGHINHGTNKRPCFLFFLTIIIKKKNLCGDSSKSCTLSQTTSSVTHGTQIWQNKEEEEKKNQQYTKYTSMMLCKQTLMCFEDSNVSQEERKEKVSKTGMGKGKRERGWGGGVNVKWEENLVFYRTGVKFRNGPTPFERNAVPD